jgi:hypothetical protein
MAHLGTAVIDFGSTPVCEGVFSVSDAGFAGQLYAEAFVMVESTVDNDTEAHQEAGAFMRLVCDPPGTGSMTVRATVLYGMVTGSFRIRYVATDV